MERRPASTASTASTLEPPAASRFRYVGMDVDEPSGTVRARYALGEVTFEETVVVEDVDGPWPPAAHEAARLLYLLAGVSYYKAAAPPVIDLGDTPLRPGDRELLRDFYVQGLGEFAYTNGLDLRELELEGGRPAGPPVSHDPPAGRPMVPFGGGIDSIVSAELVRRRHPQAALFVASRRGARFAPIERSAAVTGLPVLRAERHLDPKILRSVELGWLNGHVPVTGVLSAIAVLTAVLHGRDEVVMSNEWSASIGNVTVGETSVNHQYSKGWAFERAFRDALDRAMQTPPAYFSLLRDRSELWVARRFADLPDYHPVFRSCNRAFAIDPARRLDGWCGECDKCCFIDLILSPFLPADRLTAIFGGREPLTDPARLPQLQTLVGMTAAPKPFECVGDVTECATAAAMAAARPDRLGNRVLQALTEGTTPVAAETLMGSMGPTFAPPGYL